MDSYQRVEEIEYFPPESEELLKEHNSTILKRDQSGASLHRNFVSAGLGLVGCLEVIFLLVFLRGQMKNHLYTLTFSLIITLGHWRDVIGMYFSW